MRSEYKISTRGAEQRSGWLSSGKSFIGKRKKFIFNAFIDFKPM